MIVILLKIEIKIMVFGINQYVHELYFVDMNILNIYCWSTVDHQRYFVDTAETQANTL